MTGGTDGFRRSCVVMALVAIGGFVLFGIWWC
jgi:hypothetical protein